MTQIQHKWPVFGVHSGSACLLLRQCRLTSVHIHLSADSPQCRLTSVHIHLSADSPQCRLTSVQTHLSADSPQCRLTSVQTHLSADSPQCRLTSVQTHLSADSPQCSLTLCQAFKHPKPSFIVQHHSQPALCEDEPIKHWLCIKRSV